MSYLGLLITGFVGMLVLWSLALWLWTATATRGTAPTVASVQIPERRSGEAGDHERRATEASFAQADLPKPRDSSATKDLATQPYKRARSHVPQAAGDRPSVSRRPS
jgi:hypothetical protein